MFLYQELKEQCDIWNGYSLLICGCIPKLGALANIIPLPVLGGAMIAMFGMVMAYGVSILGNINFQNQNNLLIIAISVGLGAGISAVPQAFKGLENNLLG